MGNAMNEAQSAISQLVPGGSRPYGDFPRLRPIKGLFNNESGLSVSIFHKDNVREKPDHPLHFEWCVIALY
jgi:hypothetical protein